MLSGFTIYTIVSIALKVIIFLAFLWIRRRLYVLSFKLPGPLYIPLLGNLASFLFRKGSFFQRINLIILDNKEIFRFWVGSKLLLIVRNTEAVRHFSNLTIPSNDGKYAFTQGHGILMTQQIDRWRQHKKLIKSMINVKFIIDNIDVFKKHIDRCMIRMEKHTTEATFDVHVYIRNCYIDIFGEVILGIAIESQDGKNSDLTNALQTYSNFAFKRMLLTWTHAQFLLKILPTYRKKVKAENYLMSFTEEAIIKSWERRKTSLFPASNDRKNYAIVDEIGNYIETNLDTIQNEELRDYLLSLFLVSQQSLSYVTSYCCLYLGMYPEYQSRVLNEIQSVSSTTLKYEYLYKLKYLDAFIQEVLSVVTIRPFIFRNFTETILFENLTIPPECTIIIPSYAMQHDVAQNFRTFNPENVSQRASHCFGQGTKECIGKLLSMFSVKILLVNILKYYKIETEDKPIDFKLGDDLYTQPKDGFKIRLRKRPI